MIKWCTAGIGLIIGGWIGAIVGYFFGAMIEQLRNGGSSYTPDGSGYSYRYSSYGGRQGSAYGTGRYQNDTAHFTDNARTLFLNSLLEVSAYVICADGKIMHSEMEVLRTFLRQSFDANTAAACNERMLTIFEERKRLTPAQWRSRVMRSCRTVAMAMPQEQCLQLMSFLAAIVKADGHVDNSEVSAMRDVALAMGLDVSVVEQLLSLGGGTLDDAYKVLGISPDATDDEVRRAYRKMALQYHPDRVATLGKDVQEAAKKKFQELNDAKERIFKARGL